VHRPRPLGHMALEVRRSVGDEPPPLEFREKVRLGAESYEKPQPLASAGAPHWVVTRWPRYLRPFPCRAPSRGGRTPRPAPASSRRRGWRPHTFWGFQTARGPGSVPASIAPASRV